MGSCDEDMALLSLLPNKCLPSQLRCSIGLKTVVKLRSRDLERGLGKGVVWVCHPRFSLPRMLDLKPVERICRQLQSLEKICKKTVFIVSGSLKPSESKV